MPEKEFGAIFATNMKRYMDEYEITQVELARRLKVSATTIYYWLNGIKIPRMDKVDTMCEIFHCKRSDLINERTDTERRLNAYLEAIEDMNVQKLLDGFMLLNLAEQNQVINFVNALIMSKGVNI